MPKLRHFALVVKDQEKSAKFYQDVFGLQRVGQSASEIGSAIYLSDGTICLALLHLRGKVASGVADEENFVGTHHFGMHVEDIEAVAQKIEAAGGKLHFDPGRHLANGQPKKGNYERKFKDPDGIIFDISDTGWLGTPERSAPQK